MRILFCSFCFLIANLALSQVTTEEYIHYKVYKTPIDSVLNWDSLDVDSDAQFLGSEFQYKAFFRETNFQKPAMFLHCVFDSVAFFSGSTFDSTCIFEGSEFKSSTFFIGSHFDNGANFADTKFRKNVAFIGSSFDDQADFRLSQFESSTAFSNVTFQTIADFSNAKFGGDVTFENSVLPDFIDFSRIKTKNTIDLTFCILASEKKMNNEFCYINLVDAPIENFKLKYDLFRIYIPSEISVDDYDKISGVYQVLLKNFKDHGYENSYETLHKEYLEFQFTKNPQDFGLQREYKILLNSINKYWNDYGYEKGRIWAHTSLFFLLFFFYNWIRFPILISSVYQIKSIEERFRKNKFVRAHRITNGSYPELNIYEPLLAFYYTLHIFFGIKMETENFKWSNHSGVIYILVQYALGLICLGYLANFIVTSGLLGK